MRVHNINDSASVYEYNTNKLCRRGRVFHRRLPHAHIFSLAGAINRARTRVLRQIYDARSKSVIRGHERLRETI